MAQSKWPTQQISSTQFLESAGTILFDFRETDAKGRPASSSPTLPKIVLLHHLERDEYQIPKGRRNISEHRQDAALRETYEETGLKCHLLPITLDTRATSVNPSDDRTNEAGYTVDEVRVFENVTDPFMMTLRDLREKGKKLIWWYVAAVDEVQSDVKIEIDPGYEVVFVPVDQAVMRCTFATDREVVTRAIDVVERTFRLRWTELHVI